MVEALCGRGSNADSAWLKPNLLSARRARPGVGRVGPSIEEHRGTRAWQLHQRPPNESRCGLRVRPRVDARDVDRYLTWQSASRLRRTAGGRCAMLHVHPSLRDIQGLDLRSRATSGLGRDETRPEGQDRRVASGWPNLRWDLRQYRQRDRLPPRFVGRGSAALSGRRFPGRSCAQ